jgi:hypothetical protein
MNMEAYINNATKARIRAKIFLFMNMGSSARIGRSASYAYRRWDAIRQRLILQKP